MEWDTIAAISTPIGEGAIAIVRLSGVDSIEHIAKIFRSPSGKKLTDVASHTIHYGHLLNTSAEQVVDEVMVSVLHAPNTFTRENVVEINCHGGVTSVQKVLQTVLQLGVRLAEPGEFTKRAFLNGRIDLSQAEAVMDLIRARTDRAASMALQQIEGKLSALVQSLRQEILQALAQVEVNIDYPEYDDVEEMSHLLMKEKALAVHQSIEKLLKTANQGKILREGITTAIIGRPNVGKSSLLNHLLQENKAIVTDIPGTTRDIIEEYVNVAGIPLKLIDTAGIRETSDIVEQIGVEKSLQALERADLLLHVIDCSKPFSEADEELLKSSSKKNLIVILNKTDLTMQIDESKLKAVCNGKPIIYTSVLADEGIEQLQEAIANLFFAGNIGETGNMWVANSRHIGLLHAAKQAVESALTSIEDQVPMDIVQIDMVKAWELLGEIVGETVQEGLIDQLFSQFCLGK